MDIFEGNTGLEAVVRTLIDSAFYLRHDTMAVLVPFAAFYKGKSGELVRLSGRVDSLPQFDELLRTSHGTYDFVALCYEGRMTSRRDSTEFGAIYVKAFDTSRSFGFLYGQGFQSIGPGIEFKRIGNVQLANRHPLPLPVSLVKRPWVEPEEPYISAMDVKDPSGKVSRVIVAGYWNCSLLSARLYEAVVNSIKTVNEDFSGHFIFNFVPGTIKEDKMERFILGQLYEDLLAAPEVQEWESLHARKLEISLDFDGQGANPLKRRSEMSPEAPSGGGKGGKPWWKVW